MRNKKRRMRKKANFFAPLFFLTVTIVLTVFYITQLQEARKIKLDVGTRQGQLIKAYQEGERALFYTDTAAKLAAYSSLYQNGLSGGFSFTKEPACGNYLGFSLYVNETAECFPDVVKELEPAFNSELNRMIAGNPYDIPALSYSFQLQEAEDTVVLRGISEQHITIPIDGYERNFLINRDKVQSSHTYGDTAGASAVSGAFNYGEVILASPATEIEWTDLAQVTSQKSFDDAVASGRLVKIHGEVPFIRQSGSSSDCPGIQGASEYGRPLMKEYLAELAKGFHARFNEDLIVGDVFATKSCGHTSHYKGNAADFSYYKGDEKGRWIAETTKKWCNEAVVLFNDQTCIDAGYCKYWTNHDNHVHVSYKCSGFERASPMVN